MPYEYVSAFSGSSCGLPPTRPLYCPAGFERMRPYCAAVTPEFAHCSKLAVGSSLVVALVRSPAQGSLVPFS
jgi:hypothetical protein